MNTTLKALLFTLFISLFFSSCSTSNVDDNPVNPSEQFTTSKYYKIQSKFSNKFATIPGDGIRNGLRLEQWNEIDSSGVGFPDNQQWKITEVK